MSFRAGLLDRLQRDINDAVSRDRNHDNPLNAPMSNRAFQTFTLTQLQRMTEILVILHRNQR